MAAGTLSTEQPRVQLLKIVGKEAMKKVLLIAAALAPLTLSTANARPLSDSEFLNADDVSKIFIELGAFAVAAVTCNSPIIDKTGHYIAELPEAQRYTALHGEVAGLMQDGADTFNIDVANLGAETACASMNRAATALYSRWTRH
jgi:hypothetical protein